MMRSSSTGFRPPRISCDPQMRTTVLVATLLLLSAAVSARTTQTHVGAPDPDGAWTVWLSRTPMNKMPPIAPSPGYTASTPEEGMRVLMDMGLELASRMFSTQDAYQWHKGVIVPAPDSLEFGWEETLRLKAFMGGRWVQARSLCSNAGNYKEISAMEFLPIPGTYLFRDMRTFIRDDHSQIWFLAAFPRTADGCRLDSLRIVNVEPEGR